MKPAFELIIEVLIFFRFTRTLSAPIAHSILIATLQAEVHEVYRPRSHES